MAYGVDRIDTDGITEEMFKYECALLTKPTVPGNWFHSSILPEV